jgi:hypothetical protein
MTQSRLTEINNMNLTEMKWIDLDGLFMECEKQINQRQNYSSILGNYKLTPAQATKDQQAMNDQVNDLKWKIYKAMKKAK